METAPQDSKPIPCTLSGNTAGDRGLVLGTCSCRMTRVCSEHPSRSPTGVGGQRPAPPLLSHTSVQPFTEPGCCGPERSWAGCHMAGDPHVPQDHDSSDQEDTKSHTGRTLCNHPDVKNVKDHIFQSCGKCKPGPRYCHVRTPLQPTIMRKCGFWVGGQPCSSRRIQGDPAGHRTSANLQQALPGPAGFSPRLWSLLASV